MKPTTVILLVALLAGVFAGSAQGQSASEKKKAASLSSSLKKVRSKKAQLQAKLRTKAAASDKMEEEIHAVDRKINAIDINIEETENELASSKRDQAVLSKKLTESTAQLDRVKQQVAVRLRAIYTAGTAAPITMVRESSSFGDMAARKALVERVAAKDRELFSEVKVIRDEVLSQKKEIDRVVAKIAELNIRQEQQKSQMESFRADKKRVYNVLKAEEDAVSDELEDMVRESRKLEAQIAAIQAKSMGSVPVFNGRFIRPVGGRMTSRFGSRRHPISGKTKMHTGVDIAASSGTTIVAAGSGKVITSAYINGYGNTIVIDHGGGVSTLYGHCSRLFVSSGTFVKQGQRIAAVGSTGYSTGPHLHFEVRINGRPVNPLGKF